MSNKAELAALMASDGDFEKKISLLKKAVVTVTKQKQEIEAKQTQLQEELGSATQQLAEAQRENGVLQRKVKTLEAQLEQERSSGSAFGQNMLKGLSSIMGNSDAGGRGGRGGRGGAASAHLALSADDVERLIGENEQLHRQTYAFKTKLEDAQRASTRDAEKARGDVARLQREAQELRRALETSTAACDRLRADHLTERALADFCRHFFVAALLHQSPGDRAPSAAGSTVELRWPAHSGLHANAGSDALPAMVREQTTLTVQSAAGTLRTLLRGVSVLAVVLREQLPSRERGTVSDLECLRDRLSVFIEAHEAKKERLMSVLEQIDSLLATAAPGSAETLVEAQGEVVRLTLEWVCLLRAQLPLLVESCVAYLPQGHPYTIHSLPPPGAAAQSDAGGKQTRTTVERGEFVEEVTKHGLSTLASIEGSLMALRMLVQRSPSAYTNGDARAPVDPTSLLTLQQFWWEGCVSVRALHASIWVLNLGLADMAEACNKSEVRDALHYVCKCLEAMAAAANELRDATYGDADAAAETAPPAAFSSRRMSRTGSRSRTAAAQDCAVQPSDGGRGASAAAAAAGGAGVSADAYEELLAALAAADRAAASYYTQMNYLCVEMAEKEDAAQTALDAVAHLQRLINAERAEAEHTRQALQSQISVLSTQLVEMTDASLQRNGVHG